MSNENEKLDKFTEFECKYRVEVSALFVLKQIMSSYAESKSFLYTEGPDVFFTRDGDRNSFGRYRTAEFPVEKPKFAQWTIKTKPNGAKNSIKRKEPNWRVDGTPPDQIEAGACDMGYRKDRSVYKLCHIYQLVDATVVFYSVIPEGKTVADHFMEIEVDEDTIHNLTEDQAWAVINKYEKLLEQTGISPQKRLKKSLYELYGRED